MSQKKVYFSPPELEIVTMLQEIYECSEMVAKENVINQKRELAYIHRQRGNIELAKQITSELGEEWFDDIIVN